MILNIMSPPSPSSPTRAALKAPRAPLREFAWLVLVGILSCAWSAGLASAGAQVDTQPSRSAARVREPIVSAKSPAPSALRPQTRYTVRKQIESIEPIRWLERYGEVRIRKLRR
jgi:hypothetical protein